MSEWLTVGQVKTSYPELWSYVEMSIGMSRGCVYSNKSELRDVVMSGIKWSESLEGYDALWGFLRCDDFNSAQAFLEKLDVW